MRAVWEVGLKPRSRIWKTHPVTSTLFSMSSSTCRWDLLGSALFPGLWGSQAAECPWPLWLCRMTPGVTGVILQMFSVRWSSIYNGSVSNTKSLWLLWSHEEWESLWQLGAGASSHTWKCYNNKNHRREWIPVMPTSSHQKVCFWASRGRQHPGQLKPADQKLPSTETKHQNLASLSMADSTRTSR